MNKDENNSIERVLIPIWQDRISPVFDVANEGILFHITTNGVSEERIELPGDRGWRAHTIKLKELNVDLLICGAISRMLEESLIESGINIYPWVCGDVKTIFYAWQNNELANIKYMMPGCQRRGRKRRGRGTGNRRCGGKQRYCL